MPKWLICSSRMLRADRSSNAATPGRRAGTNDGSRKASRRSRPSSLRARISRIPETRRRLAQACDAATGLPAKNRFAPVIALEKPLRGDTRRRPRHVLRSRIPFAKRRGRGPIPRRRPAGRNSAWWRWASRAPSRVFVAGVGVACAGSSTPAVVDCGHARGAKLDLPRAGSGT